MLEYKINKNNLSYYYTDIKLRYRYMDDDGNEKIVYSINDVPYHYLYRYRSNDEWIETNKYSDVPEYAKTGKRGCLQTFRLDRYDYICDSFSYPYYYISEEGIRELAFSFEEIPVSRRDTKIVAKEFIVITAFEPHRLIDGQKIILYRSDGPTIEYRQEIDMRVIDERRLLIDNPSKYEIFPLSTENEYHKSHPHEHDFNTVVLYFDNSWHNYVENKSDIKISEYLTDEDKVPEERNDTGNPINKLLNRKAGDYVIYNDEFLYKACGVDKNNNYILPCKYRDKENGEIIDIDECQEVSDEDALNYIAYPMYENTMAKVEIIHKNKDEETKYLDGIYEFAVPAIGNKDDNRRLLYNYSLLDKNRKSVAEYVLTNFDALSFFSKDERFMYETTDDEDNEFIKAQNGLRILAKRGGLKINVKMEQDYNNDLFKEGIYNEKLVEETKDKIINGTVDYEKHTFEPVFIDASYEDGEVPDDNSIKDIDEIVFNLHFLEREKKQYTDEYGYKLYDYGEWKAIDGALWNGYMFSGDTLIHKSKTDDSKNVLNETNGDILGHLGFVDDDIYYRKMRLKETFLRISFYDTPYRATQKLLYYSTIFINTGSLYGKYIMVENLYNKGGNKNEDYVMNEMTSSLFPNSSLRLEAQFSCKNKYDMNNGSEGFYAYMFSHGLNEKEIMPVYAKVEFNSAKYGVTIPFIMPMDENYHPLNVEGNEFPYNYTVKDDDGDVSVNMKRLNTDLYIKMYLKYDFVKNRYVYFLPRKKDEYNGENDGHRLIFNLFEPRLNIGNKEEKCKG